MTDTCKIDHDDTACIPVMLCRACGTIRVPTPAELRDAAKADRKRIASQVAKDSLARQVRTLELKIEKLTPHAREPREGSISAKLLASYRGQLKKLRRKIDK